MRYRTIGVPNNEVPFRTIGVKGVVIVCSGTGRCDEDSAESDSVTLLAEWRKGSP